MPQFSYHGTYKVINRQKYIGNKEPAFRSRMECLTCRWLDLNTNVVRWGYEIVSIPYLFSIDQRVHTYIVDLYAEIRNVKGEINKYLIEIKPTKELQQPVPPKNRNQKALDRYKREMYTYIKNQNKWESAKQFCDAHGMKFTSINETEIKNSLV